MISLLLVLVGVLLLAYVNGANDTFKGVATLYGSRTTSYRRALALATIATFLGSASALLIARDLLLAFSGKGLVPDAFLYDGRFPIAIGFGAASTVLLATRLGLPISTTHALTGALVGTGLVAGSVNVAVLGSTFALPLLVSPVLAAALAMGFYPAARWLRHRFALTEDSCVCVDDQQRMRPLPAGAQPESELSQGVSRLTPKIRLRNAASCSRPDVIFGLNARTAVDAVHYLSAGLVSFARGLNDTPKIAGILILVGVAGDLSQQASLLAIGFAMAVGAVISARRVAERMSWDITSLNIGQGMAANLVTSSLVLGATRLGLPVSTTHVACGALFGIGVVTGNARWRTVLTILLAWVITLPVSATTAALAYWAALRWL